MILTQIGAYSSLSNECWYRSSKNVVAASLKLHSAAFQLVTFFSSTQAKLNCGSNYADGRVNCRNVVADILNKTGFSLCIAVHLHDALKEILYFQLDNCFSKFRFWVNFPNAFRNFRLVG